jgi:hypothetical protein
MLNSNMERKLVKGKHTRTALILFGVIVLLMIIFGSGGFGSEALIINEVMTSNRSTIADEDGDFPDWIELYNSGAIPMNLEGFWLSDDPAQPLKWQFPEMTLAPGEYLVVFASGKDRFGASGSLLHTNFRLSANSAAVVLSAPDGKMTDSVKTGAMFSNISYGRRPGRAGSWVYYFEATPGARNADQGQRSIEIGQLNEEYPIYFNEFVAANRTSLYDLDGDLSDWVEMYHSGEEPLNLKGYWLSDDPANPFKWRFPDVTVDPGEHLIIYASGKAKSVANKRDLHTSFSLNDTTDILTFTTPDGKIIETMPIRNMIDDVSYGLLPGQREEWRYFPTPTPGRENTTQGFKADELTGKEVKTSYNIRINEVMAMNTKTLTDENNEYVDWIELYNAGDIPVNLAGFGLSDREESPFRWVFPAVTMQPKSHLVVYASGKDRAVSGRNLHTNFSLSSKGETLVLTSPESGMVDRLATGMQSPGLSVGRYPDGAGERFFFTAPTPGRPNPTTNLTGIALPPAISHLGGRFDGSIQVELKNPLEDRGAIVRYTLNGKEPDSSSQAYTGPISINRTTTLRARTFLSGSLPSKSVTQTYLINEKTELAVLSIIMDPRDLFDPAVGIHVKGYGASSEFPYKGANFWQKWERPMHFQLIEPDGTLGFSADAGIRIGGQYSRAMDQKIFNIFARNRYGSDVMEYPFFPDKGLTTYKALTIRQSGQDAVLSRLRDAMMTSLLSETNLDYQAYRPIVVYINGQYWGLYNIRERINEYYIAYNHDAVLDKIDMIQANTRVRAGSSADYVAMRTFIANNDMRVAKNYEYIKTQMDVQNYMDYWIAQIYFANTDSANIRFWRERDNPESKWRWIVYDTDWGFFNVNHNTLDHVTHPQGTGVGRNLSTVIMVNLLKNNEFRTEFIQRMAFHLNNTFTEERVIGRIDEMQTVIEHEMPRQIERWGGSMESWNRQVERLRNFARNRNRILMGHIQAKFNLSNKEMEIFDDWPVR